MYREPFSFEKTYSVNVSGVVQSDIQEENRGLTAPNVLQILAVVVAGVAIAGFLLLRKRKGKGHDTL
ncbi:MAG: hypothetical protein HY619_06195 [Thaumarchaeota archaeon]|nr:hypothetical protein [Nitrososphaerota archaeon]